VPWPAKCIPLLLIAATLVDISTLERAWSRRLIGACATASVVMTVQLLVLGIYAYVTARGHELPRPFAELLGLIPRWWGADATIDGSWIVVRGADQVHRIAATWELLLDPATVLFVAGAAAFLAWTRGLSWIHAHGWSKWAQDSCRLCLIGLIWAPLRAALMIAIVLQRALRADAITEPNVADVLVNSWIHVGLLAGPVLMATWFLPRPTATVAPAFVHPTCSDRRRVLSSILTAGGIGLIVFVALWSPLGSRKPGPITFVERHSTWEPTQQPYGTTVYGEAGSYNYAAAYAYCEQYFPMARILEQDTIDDKSLADCSVLIIKTPTSRYALEEIDAVQRFVQRGGSLLLIGDHTNVFNMNTYLNDIGRRFGLTFRNDLLFHVGDPYRQHDPRPWPAHAILQHLPSLDFAVSCSIDPGRSWGRMVMRNEGLFSLPPAYHESNYHPQAEYRPQMQYGSWCQMWAGSFGKGRVLAFADSTLFSNFCVFQPGKAELLRGMLDWLARSSIGDRAPLRRAGQISFLLLGVSLIVAGLALGADQQGNGAVLLSACLAGGTLVAQALLLWQAHVMPIPVRERPLPHVVIDRQLSQVPLFTGAFADDKEGLGYGMLEQWIPRVGMVISRSSKSEPFFGDGLVVICPTVSVSDQYLQGLTRFVQQGGDVLIFDSPDVLDSTANSLLAPFGMRSYREGAEQIQGQLRWPGAEALPPLELLAACRIDGGQPLALVDTTAVAAQATYGAGRVTVAGFGSLFNDAAMGFHWLPEPEPLIRQRYEALYYLLRASLLKSATSDGGPTN